jgi:hypothetical protein
LRDETTTKQFVSDSAASVQLRPPLTIEDDKTLEFSALMKLAGKNSGRFGKVMTCRNIACAPGRASRMSAAA